jgi:DNA-binding transcriptional MocR family regulator
MSRSTEKRRHFFMVRWRPKSVGPSPREKLDPEERLPLAKDMAAVLGVNKNTGLRALHILSEEGLLDFQRGRGITVAGTPQQGVVVKWPGPRLAVQVKVKAYERESLVDSRFDRRPVRYWTPLKSEDPVNLGCAYPHFAMS